LPAPAANIQHMLRLICGENLVQIAVLDNICVQVERTIPDQQVMQKSFAIRVALGNIFKDQCWSFLEFIQIFVYSLLSKWRFDFNRQLTTIKAPHNKVIQGRVHYGQAHSCTQEDYKAVSQNVMHSTIGITVQFYSNMNDEEKKKKIDSMIKSNILKIN